MGLVQRVGRRSRDVARETLEASAVRVGRKPDFLIIGAQKAGTSSLYSWLTEHPDVLSARRKELHFFDRQPTPPQIREYWTHFPSNARVQALRLRRRRVVVTGEATPIYLFDPRVPRMVHHHIPTTKLIVLLRDPVERAVSHYWMEFNRGDETLPLEEALALEHDRLAPEFTRLEHGHPPGQLFRTASYVARGRYAEQLERWFELFPRSSFHIIEFEELAHRPEEVYRETLAFLGVDPDAADPPPFDPVRVGRKQATSPETLDLLRERFVEPNERLAELVGVDYNASSGTDA